MTGRREGKNAGVVKGGQGWGGGVPVAGDSQTGFRKESGRGGTAVARGR